jgi:lycopene beta-cyclase
MQEYDYIIVGGGCSGLSLLYRLANSAPLKNKSILLIEPNYKTKNDRTWCFWESESGYFESTVSKAWDQLRFENSYLSFSQNIAPFKYKMIRSSDFYTYVNKSINSLENITTLKDEVVDMNHINGVVSTKSGKSFLARDYIFSSISFIDWKEELKPHQILLYQHFKGWYIKTKSFLFNPDIATYMNFNVSQEFGTAFIYFLPLTSNTALVEYTLFTEKILEEKAYVQQLINYLNQNKIFDYEIEEEEFGIIPMTNYAFPTVQKKIVYIGTIGGATKPSTGYTFTFIQKQSDYIVNCLEKNKIINQLNGAESPLKYKWYDSTLLQILKEYPLEGHKVFHKLFKRNPMQRLLRFLNNESTIMDEIKIMLSVNIFQFLPAACKQLYYLLRR